MAAEKSRSQFSFIKRNHSVRTKEKKPRDEEGALSRWLRELRGGPDPKVPTLDRNNPIYHSEGKGLGSKKNGKGKRRHSFNQRPHHAVQTRCCGEREDDAGRGTELAAMTGGSPKNNNFIINPSDRAPRVKGHEKGASWGGEEPQPLRQQRANSFTQQLKTVMERCEKMSPVDKFLPKVDRDGKILGDSDYSIPSPPERDLSHLSHLDHFSKYNETRLSQLSIDGGYDGSQTSLTRAELEQYTRTYEDVRPVSHSQQPSYAQSEGYHSYVSSADSTTTTPFLDRLRRDNIETSGGVGGGGGGGRESSASSGSSSETLKWHGSLSDVSTSGGTSTTQHIAHSARVPMPQRHHSESVLYLDPQHQNNINNQMRRLFPVTTYEPTSPRQLIESYSPSSSSRSQPKLSVAERVCEIERQSSQQSRPSHLSSQQDLDKRLSRLPDHATLKAMQKKALLSFYERHHSAWKSEPQLTTPSGPPVPPPRPQPPLPATASRRSSSASDYAGAVKREIPRSHLDLSKVESNGMRESKHQHSSSCGSLSSAALGPMIVGPAISVDDWVPARPPKKPHLRAYQPLPRGTTDHPPPRSAELPPRSNDLPPPPRAPTPDLPPPSPPPIVEEELLYPDEPLPPPPPEEFFHPNHSSHPARQDKARYERAMNASMSLDNLTRSDKPLQLAKPLQDGYYENGRESDAKRVNTKPHDHSLKNGFMEKFNERYVENRIEAIQSQYADLLTDVWDKKPSLDVRRFGGEKKPPLEPPTPLRHSLLSPALPNKKRPHSHVPEQPRSLDSNLSIVESNNEVNKPGPQTPVNKKYPKDPPYNAKSLRDSFVRATSVPNDLLVKNSSERQSLRFTTATQKLHVNGKIANAVQNGKISPTSRKANLVRTPSDVTRRVSYSHGIHHAEPLGAKPLSPIDGLKQLCTEIPSKPPPPVPKSPPESPPMSPSGCKPPPALPPHCPPTTLQLSQSKASYLSYRREPKEKEKGLPNFQGSYKRTMSPNGARISDSAGCLNEMAKSVDAEMKKLALCDEEPQVEEPPPSQQERPAETEREALSKTLPRNYSLSAAAAATVTAGETPVAAPTATKRASRPPRAQSDPTSSAKVEKKSVAVSASTQDNLDEDKEEGKVILVGRSQSDRTGESRRESRMSDAASQTTPTPSPPPLPASAPRRPLQEEIDCDRLSRDLASQLSPSHKLHGILVPGPEVKRTTDYVSGLFKLDYAPRSRTSLCTPTPTTNGQDGETPPSSNTSFPSDVASRLNGTDCAPAPVPAPVSSMSSLQQKKQELMLRLTKKLSVLRSESVAVNEEIAVNEALGLTVTERVEKVARPQEVAKFRLHVKEVGHITSLLLSLSGRLARAENALLTLSTNHQDRKLYEEKRDKLLCQLNEAKQLKSNIDQRSNLVSSMLYNYLTGEEYTDYDHFINMKSKLLVDSREIAEKIQLGEEQLSALKETLDQVR